MYCDESLYRMIDDLAEKNKWWRENKMYEEYLYRNGDDDYGDEFEYPDDEDFSERNDGCSSLADL